MPSVRENLIAARALIDTTRKYEMRRAREGSAIASAFYEVGRTEGSVDALFAALEPHWIPRPSHETLMQVFDRAIASQEQKNGE